MPGEQLINPSTSRLSLYATTFMVGVVVISLGPLLDSITKDLGIPLAQAGLIADHGARLPDENVAQATGDVGAEHGTVTIMRDYLAS